MRLLARGLVAALLAVAGAARADDAPRAPLNPAAKAQVGDWLAVKVTIDERGLQSSSTNVLAVTAVESGAVTVKSTVGGGAKTFWRHEAPLIATLVGAPPGAKLTLVKVTDEKRRACGRDLDTKRVDYEIGGSDPFEGTVWLSADVTVAGLVAMKAKGTGEGNSGLSIELELVGCGTKEKTLLGATRAEAEKAAGAGR